MVFEVTDPYEIGIKNIRYFYRVFSHQLLVYPIGINIFLTSSSLFPIGSSLFSFAIGPALPQPLEEPGDGGDRPQRSPGGSVGVAWGHKLGWGHMITIATIMIILRITLTKLVYNICICVYVF